MTIGAPVGPEILIPRRIDPNSSFVLTRPGGVTPWGNDRTTYNIAVGNPEGWAELAADNGLIRYLGQGQYADLDGNSILPGDVLPRLNEKLLDIVGPRMLVSKHAILTPFGGQVPEGMRDMKAFMQFSKENIEKTSFPDAYQNMLKTATEDQLFMLFAGARSLLLNAHTLDEAFPDPRRLGIFTARGLPGVSAFTHLTLAAFEGKKRTGGQVLPNSLASAAMGNCVAVLGPKGDEVPNELESEEWVRTMGTNLQASYECASFHGILAMAANRMASIVKGRPPMTGIQVTSGEAPHGIPEARLSAVGFNSLQAMETLDSLKARVGDQDIKHAYAPFTNESNGFWPGEGAGFLTNRLLSEAVERGELFDAFLAGWSVYPDQGNKSNHAKMGIGIINAIKESMNMASAGYGIGPDDIDYASFHGTATPETNAKEPLYLLTALKSLGLTKKEKRIKATALKAFLTHLLGGAGAAEMMVILQAMRHGKAPGIFNLINGRKIIVPAEILEYIDFSSENLDGDLDVAISLSEGFSGNNAALVLANASDERLAQAGYDATQIRVLRERQAEKIYYAREIEEKVRTGKLSYVEFLDLASFKDRDVRMAPSTSRRPKRQTPQHSPVIAEEFRSLQDQLGKVAFSANQWAILPVYQILKALETFDADQFSSEIDHLKDVLMRLRANDPSAYFIETGLSSVIQLISSNPRVLLVLSKSTDLKNALGHFVEPKPIRSVEVQKIATNVIIPLQDQKVALGFPGQGAFDGEKRSAMARSLYESDPDYREVVDQCHERLFQKYKYDLKSMLFSGAPDLLVQTVHQQPVLATDEIARSVRIMKRLEAKGVTVQASYGDSLGLIPAAYAAGYFQSPADAVEFAFLRAKVMGEKNPFGPDARPMALIPGYEEDRVQDVVREVNETFGLHVVVSKRNGVGKLVISGEPEAINLVGQRLAALGGTQMEIPVSTPFHDSHYFAEAAQDLLLMAQYAELSGTPRKKVIPLIANSTGKQIPEGTNILEFLASEIAKPVDLVASMQSAARLGANVFLEIGPKSTMTSDVAASLGNMEETPGLIRAEFISTPEQLDKFLDESAKKEEAK